MNAKQTIISILVSARIARSQSENRHLPQKQREIQMAYEDAYVNSAKRMAHALGFDFAELCRYANYK